MKSKIKAHYLILILVLVALGGGFLVFALTSGSPPDDADWGFPTMRITVPETPFEERDLRQDGTISVIDPAGNFSFEEAEAMVRGRGNSTWWDGPEKRPLRFRFAEARSMFGSEYEARNWILLANLFDRSLLRNYATLYFADQLGRMDFVPSVQNVHLYVNDEYMGVYLLTDERDVNPGRLEIEWDPDPSRSGFFLELDARAPNDAVENEDFIIVNHMAYDLRWPDFPDELTPEHVEYLKAYLEAVSAAIRARDFAEIVSLIDLDSFVDFYLVQELVKNIDAHYLSVFMHITGVEDARRLYKGPVWDFDMVAGNYKDQPLGTGPERLYVAVLNYWYRELMQTPEFFDAVVTRWNEIRDVEVAQTIARVQHLATEYQADFERNFERHPVMGAGTWPTPPELLEIEDFSGHVAYLVHWLEARALWMDDFFNGRLPDHDPLWALVEYYQYESPIHILLDENPQQFDIAPVILQDRTIMALPEIVRLLDLNMEYNPATETVTLSRDGTTITHRYGDTFMDIDGVETDFLLSSFFSVRGEAFFPLYSVVRAFGFTVAWHEELERTLVITSP